MKTITKWMLPVGSMLFVASMAGCSLTQFAGILNPTQVTNTISQVLKSIVGG